MSDRPDTLTTLADDYEYTLDAFDAQGRRFAHRTVTLTIQ